MWFMGVSGEEARCFPESQQTQTWGRRICERGSGICDGKRRSPGSRIGARVEDLTAKVDGTWVLLKEEVERKRKVW